MHEKILIEKKLSLAGDPLAKNLNPILEKNTENLLSKSRNLLISIRKQFRFNIIDSVKFVIKDTPYAFGPGLKYINQPPYHWSKPFHYTFILPSMLIFTLIFVYGIYKTSNEKVFFLLILLSFPIIAVFIIKLLCLVLLPLGTRHVLQVLPLFYIFIALGLGSIQFSKLRLVLLFALVCYTAISLSIYYFDKRTYKDDWRYVSTHVLSNLTSKDFIIYHGEYPRISFLYYTLLNSNNRKIWETEKPANMLIRGRDGSFNEFLHSVYDRILVEKKRIWVITYYADQKEKNFLRTHIEKNFRPIQRKSNLGRNLSVELYRSLQTTSSMEKICSEEGAVKIRDDINNGKLFWERHADGDADPPRVQNGMVYMSGKSNLRET